MSNVQASFRTAIGIESKILESPRANDSSTIGNLPSAGLGLSDIIANINELICRNSQPDQFITFFVCVYDRRQKSLSYINAGHNPPMLARASGGIDHLGEGGLILGAMPEMKYDQGEILLNEGDQLLLYTDGVSEAENSRGEMCGEKRIEQLLVASIKRSPEELLEHLEKTVVDFAGDPKLADDFTILAARIIN